ncbi:MAG: hypothetical protein K2J77_07480 [Oscillospiraceae bacterium]|nr:hypothetical protein [Oscillospiraceae bacterium]
MKKTLKMAVSGVLALTIAGGVASSASAATTPGSLVMYHNIQGGPSQLTDSCTIARNPIDNLYDADCTYLYNAKPTITVYGKETNITHTGSNYFTIPNAGSTIYITGKLNTIDNSDYSRANINIGY